MPTYAIGDLQGCFLTFQKLLERIEFDPSRDRLWLTGDLVNRGPRSLETLRWLVAHDAQVVAVLGNHDLHLLALSEGLRRWGKRDTVRPVLDAPDRDALLDWLRTRPLLHREGDLVLVHGGLLPAWTIGEAETAARDAETALTSRPKGFLRRLRGPSRGGALGRAARTTNVLTRIRTVDSEGRPAYGFAGAPEEAPRGQIPWFQSPHPRPPGVTVVFGHWAALGFRVMEGAVALDSGCVWGKQLTALRLEDRRAFQVEYSE